MLVPVTPSDKYVYFEEKCQYDVNNKETGIGSVYISNEKITLVNDEGLGFELLYDKIEMIGLNEERIHLEYSGLLENGTSLSDDDVVVQIPCHYTFKFLLDNIDKAKSMYGHIQTFQSQHVNNQPEISEEYLWKDGDFFTDPSGMQYLTPKGHEIYERLEAMLRESSNMEDDELSDVTAEVEELDINNTCENGDVATEVVGQFDDADESKND